MIRADLTVNALAACACPDRPSPDTATVVLRHECPDGRAWLWVRDEPDRAPATAEAEEAVA